MIKIDWGFKSNYLLLKFDRTEIIFTINLLELIILNQNVVFYQKNSRVNLLIYSVLRVRRIFILKMSVLMVFFVIPTLFKT
jgi:hypothetical protein